MKLLLLTTAFVLFVSTAALAKFDREGMTQDENECINGEDIPAGKKYNDQYRARIEVCTRALLTMPEDNLRGLDLIYWERAAAYIYSNGCLMHPDRKGPPASECRYDEALKDLGTDISIARKRDNQKSLYPALKTRAWINMRLARWPQAIQDLQEVIEVTLKVDRLHPDYIFQLARAYDASGDLDNARARFEEVLTTKAKPANIKEEDEVREFDKEVELLRERSKNILANIKKRQGTQWSRVDMTSDEDACINPPPPKSGASYNDEKHTRLVTCERALKTLPQGEVRGRMLAYYKMALTHAYMNDCVINPDFKGAPANKCEYDAAVRDVSEAIKLAKEANDDFSLGIYTYLRAQLFLRKEDWKKALADMTEVVTIRKARNSLHPLNLYFLAKAQFGVGDLAAAKATTEEFVEMPSSEEAVTRAKDKAKMLLAEINLKMNRREATGARGKQH
jgi:tetratricopeptide (TPR) repeat protein